MSEVKPAPSSTSPHENWLDSDEGKARYASQTTEVAAALEVWKKGLLTVSGASRLVNYKPTKSRSVTIDSPSADDILRRLDAGGEWTFEGLQEDAAEQNPADPVATTAAQQAVLTSSTPHKDLGPVLRSIMRQANTEWLDRGLHVLYLAFGMLEWRDVDDSQYLSPLVLVPVALIPVGPKDIPRLMTAEDEPVLNPALRVHLSRMGVELPAPEELDGLDIELQLIAVQETVSKRAGWRVNSHAVLSMFSFHKEAMYKDLVENADTILAHPIVRMLGTSDPLKQAAGLGFEPIDPDDIDRLAPPETTPLVLDADSSQRAAIAGVIEGHSFVMDGPPGTGKSQTIANMIGALMHAGKSVLFVSEKAAALEVVRNRLTLVGLQPYLFELHSSKTSRKEVATELLHSLENKPRPPAGMSEHDRSLAASHREDLNSYASAMNERREPLGRSLHEVLGRISQLASTPHAPIPRIGVEAITAEDYWQLQELTRTLQLSWRPAEQGTSFLWKDVVDKAPLEERFLAVRNSSEELHAAMAVNPALVEAYALRTPSSAVKLSRLLDLREQRPDDVPDAWLTAESLEQTRLRVAALAVDLATISQTEADWLQSSGTPWRELAGFATADPSEGWAGGLEFDAERLTADGCVLLAEHLGGLATRLEHSLASSRRLALALGLPSPATIQDVDRVLALTQLAAAAEKPLAEWLTTGTSTSARAANVLEASIDKLDQLEGEARPYFTDAALQAPVEDLLNRFRNQHKGLKKLGSAYRTDKKQVSEIIANDVAVAEGIKGLEKAVAWARANFDYQTEAQSSSPALGSYWSARATSFEATRRALAVADRAKVLLGGLPMTQQLISHLTETSASSLLGPASEVERHITVWRASYATARSCKRTSHCCSTPFPTRSLGSGPKPTRQPASRHGFASWTPLSTTSTQRGRASGSLSSGHSPAMRGQQSRPSGTNIRAAWAASIETPTPILVLSTRPWRGPAMSAKRQLVRSPSNRRVPSPGLAPALDSSAPRRAGMPQSKAFSSPSQRIVDMTFEWIWTTSTAGRGLSTNWKRTPLVKRSGSDTSSSATNSRGLGLTRRSPPASSRGSPRRTSPAPWRRPCSGDGRTT